MRKKLILGTILTLSLVFIVSAACVAPAFAVTTQIEHDKGSGSSIIDVPGQTQILVLAQHWGKSDFYAGKADRIALYVSTGLAPPAPPFKHVASYEDNPTRIAFSQKVDEGGSIQLHLVKRGQIQILRTCKTVIVYWTVPLVALATTTTPEVTLPPGCLVLRGYGDVKSRVSVGSYPSGWSYRLEQQTGYDAKATLFCPSWHYFGPVAEPPNRSPSIYLEGTMTWTHP